MIYFRPKSFIYIYAHFLGFYEMLLSIMVKSITLILGKNESFEVLFDQKWMIQYVSYSYNIDTIDLPSDDTEP